MIISAAHKLVRGSKIIRYTLDFREWTNANMLRDATFVRIWDDKAPRKVVRET